MRFLECVSCLRECLYTFREVVNRPQVLIVPKRGTRLVRGTISRASLKRLSDMRLMLQAVSTQL